MPRVIKLCTGGEEGDRGTHYDYWLKREVKDLRSQINRP